MDPWRCHSDYKVKCCDKITLHYNYITNQSNYRFRPSDLILSFESLLKTHLQKVKYESKVQKVMCAMTRLTFLGAPGEKMLMLCPCCFQVPMKYSAHSPVYSRLGVYNRVNICIHICLRYVIQYL